MDKAQKLLETIRYIIKTSNSENGSFVVELKYSNRQITHALIKDHIEPIKL